MIGIIINILLNEIIAPLRSWLVLEVFQAYIFYLLHYGNMLHILYSNGWLYTQVHTGSTIHIQRVIKRKITDVNLGRG